MSVIVGPADPYTTRIVVQTTAGNDVDNEQFYEITAGELMEMDDIAKAYGDVIQPRSEPDPIYNCHGMVFAARRTAIWRVPEVQKVLREDQYSFMATENVLPGDIIIYYEGDWTTNKIEHTGIVVTCPKDDPLSVPLVYSKWGKHREFVHPANQCPYNFSTARYARIVRKK